MRLRSRFDEYRFSSRSVSAGMPPAALRMTKFIFRWPPLKRRFPDYQRQQAAVELPVEPLRCQAPPAVQLLVVAAEKDFETLPLCLAGALANSGNPISEVVVITTAVGVDECCRIASDAAKGFAVTVLNEDDQLSRRFGAGCGLDLECGTDGSCSSCSPQIMLRKVQCRACWWLMRTRCCCIRGVFWQLTGSRC